MDISAINNDLVTNTLNEAKRKETDGKFNKILSDASKSGDEKALKKTCRDFESILVSMMFKEMRATVPKSSLLPDDQGEKIFQSMLDDKLSEEATKGNGIGLADMLYKQLSKGLKGGKGDKVSD